MCSAAHWAKNEVVIGSSDHALYIVDAEKVSVACRGFLSPRVG